MKSIALVVLAALATLSWASGVEQEDRIIGGYLAERDEFPFAVSIQRRTIVGFAHRCAGAVYNEYWIVTSAQCVFDVEDPLLLRVVANELSFLETSGEEQIRGVIQFLINPRFKSDTLEHDIALVELNTPLDFSSGSVGPIRIPTILGLDTLPGTTVTTIGWGAITAGGIAVTDRLRKIDTQVISDAECGAAYGGVLPPAQICSTVPFGGAGPCDGDTGGPVFTRSPLQLVGLVSYSYGCALREYPAVSTQVSYYAEWIDYVVGIVPLP